MTKIDEDRIDAVLCMRVADLEPLDTVPEGLRELMAKVRDRSIETECSMCGEKVLFDAETGPSAPRKVCLHCAIGPEHAAEILSRGGSNGIH